MSGKENGSGILRALGEPVLPSFSEELRLTKRNLLFVGAVAVFLTLAEITPVQGEISVMGLRFTSPEPFWLDLMLLLVMVYLVVQYSWQMIDYIIGTRIAVTGTRLKLVTVGKGAHDGADYPEDPQQSSLYYWWREAAERCGGLVRSVKSVEQASAAILARTSDRNETSTSQSGELVRQAKQLEHHAQQLQNKMATLVDTLSAERIPVSLGRFDRWFACYSRSQVVRLFVLDVALPLLLTMFGLLMICRSILCKLS